MKSCLHVLGHLFRGFEVHLVNGVFIELAVRRGIIAANLRARVVDSATMVRLQVFAICVNEQVPRAILDKDRRSVVKQVPTDKVQILLGGRCIDRQSKVSTTLGRAVFAERLTFWNLLSRRLLAIDGFGWEELDRLRKSSGGHKSMFARQARVLGHVIGQ